MRRVIDLSGLRFGMLVVNGRAGYDPSGKTTWLCRCDCGQSATATGLNLKSGNTKSCGCLKSRRQAKDITGRKFGRLTARDLVSTARGISIWRCVCECGGITELTYGRLTSGHTKSCGCLQSENSSALASKNLAGRKGPEHPRWDPSISDAERSAYRSTSSWRSSVLTRDKFVCAACHSEDARCAHHIVGYARCVERRKDISNGATLCEPCHHRFHSQYGTAKFTRSDFFSFLEAPDPGDFSPYGGPPSGVIGSAMRMLAEASSSPDPLAALCAAREVMQGELARLQDQRTGAAR